MRWPSRVFLSGQAVSLLGDGLAVLAIPLLVLGLTRSPLISALSAATTTLGYLAVGLPAGVLVDRLDAWRVMVTMDAVRAAGFAALYLLWVTGAARLWVIMTIALAGGAASVFFETALVVVVKDLFPGARLIRANSVLELATQAALVAGPLVVGVLAAAGELGAALLADAVTFAVSLVTLLAVRERVPHPPRRAGREGGWGGGWDALTAEFRAGLRYLLSVRVLVIMTVVLLGRVTSTVRLLFLTADPVGVVIAGSLTAAIGSPRPVFLGAGLLVAVTAAAGWRAGLSGPPR